MSLIAQKLISASGPKEATDADFPLVTGLYHFDGSNGAQNNTFLDSSDSGHTLTRNGNTTQGTFSPFSADEGKWGVLFEEDNSDFLSFDNADFTFGTGDYTVECFVLFTGNDTTSGGIFQTANSGTSGSPAMALRDTTGLTIYTSSGQKITGNNGTFALGVWYHLAFVRASSVVKVYKDGSLVTWDDGTTSVADTTNITSTEFAIGRYYSNDYTLDGYISNFRVVKGTAVYTGAFTKPTTPLTDITNTVLLTCRENRFRDASSEGNTVSIGAGTPKIKPFSPFAPSAEYDSAVNGGSGYFDGTTDYLRLPSSSDFDFSGSFTIEVWVYIEDLSTSRTILGTCANVGNAGGIYFGTSGNDLIFFQYITNTTIITSSSSIIKHQWNHVAAVRNGSVITLYINGTSVGNTTFSNSFSGDSANGGVGGFYSNPGVYYFDGYMSDMRVVNGTAVYTSNFTPPTAPLTKVTNTKLLANFTNAAIIDSTGKNNVETGGTAQLDTTVKKFGTASYESDGSTSSFLILSNSNMFPTGFLPFTIEGFIYINSPHKNYNNIISLGFGVQMYVDSGGKLICWLGNSSGAYFVNGLQSTATISLLTWTHIALVRNSVSPYTSNTVTWFVNGTAGGQTTEGVSNSIAPVGLYNTNASIGAYPTGAYIYDGFLDELRITNKARYTSNFTAPTKEFPNR